MESYNAQPLDLMQFINTKYHEPFIHEMIEFEDEIDKVKLENAIKKLADIFPLLKCRYDFKNNKFIENEKFSVYDIFKTDNAKDKNVILTESLDSSKNLILFTLSENTLFVTISHLVCDGSSFKELIYLLGEIYSDNTNNNDYEYLMKRDFTQVSKNIKLSKSDTFKMLASMLGGYKNRQIYQSLENEYCFVIERTLPKNDMDEIHKLAKERLATLNDVFLTAYARALSKVSGHAKINIPCTVDLRKYADEKTGIANLTGTYNLNVKISKNDNFENTLSKFSLAMKKQKITKNDIAGPMLLVAKYNNSSLDKFLKLYGNMKTSAFTDYTNLGIIDSNKLSFSGVKIKNAVGYSGLQKSPCFQIAVSSFNGQTTFSTIIKCDKKAKEYLENVFDILINEMKSFKENAK